MRFDLKDDPYDRTGTAGCNGFNLSQSVMAFRQRKESVGSSSCAVIEGTDNSTNYWAKCRK